MEDGLAYVNHLSGKISPDLTTYAFLFVGSFRHVYMERPENLQDLMQSLRQDVNAITVETIQNSFILYVIE